MGIHGIYKEIGPGQRIALSKVAVEHFEKTGRPLRIAIDTSIWLFQIQSSKGGTNPALRTFYYRLLRLISLSIHPLFVFDGPNRPPFKRNKRTGPNVASIPEFLAKQLLKQFGLPFHLAPGEAEAECALLQREGIVDAVLSEDVDTLMFGSGLTFRSWTPEASKSKVPTHINLYDAKSTKESSGMDREGMILVALMSGGDYVPEGIPGCGPKTACEAARAGFGHDLCQISRRDRGKLREWKDRLVHELHTNESKFFNRKHGKLAIPDDFPNSDVLGYYTHPVLSSRDKVEKIRRELKWDMDMDFKELRSFTADAFDWTKLGGAKKFIRNLAPALFVRELRMQGEALAHNLPDLARPATCEEEPHVKAIHGRRNHASTDNVPELRITFTPHELVPIDLEAEEPDDEIGNGSSDDDGDLVPEAEAPASPSKKRAPSSYDPTQVEKLWVFETYVRAGAPLTVLEWEKRANNTRIRRTVKEKHKTAALNSGIQKGPLDSYATSLKNVEPDSSQPSSPQAVRPTQRPEKSRTAKSKAKMNQPPTSIRPFAKVTKPGLSFPAPKSSQELPPGTQGHRWLGNGRLEVFKSPEPQLSACQIDTIDLVSSPQPNPSASVDLLSDIPELLPPTVTKRRRSPLRRWATDTAILDLEAVIGRPKTPSSRHQVEPIPSSPSSLPSPSQLLPVAKKAKVPKAKQPISSQMKPSTPRRRKNDDDAILIQSSSPSRQANLYDYFSPSRRAAPGHPPLEPIADLPVSPLVVESLNLTGTSTRLLGQYSPRGDTSDMIASIDLTGVPLKMMVGQSLEEFKTSQGNGQEVHDAAEQHGQAYQSPGFAFSAQSPLALPTQESSTSASADCAMASAAQTFTRNLKSVYRVRESLPGSFAIDAIDMTNDVGTKNVKVPKKGKQFRASEVSVLDLTGD